MSDHSRSYRPWGQVRRKNMISRVAYVMAMTVLGLAVIAALILLAIFTGAILLAGGVFVAMLGLAALFRRKPAHAFVRSEDAKGVLEARKAGSTWTVY